MDVEHIADAYVSSREHVGRVAIAEADMTEESLVQNRVEHGAVVVAALAMAPNGRSGRSGAVRGSGFAHVLSIDRPVNTVSNYPLDCVLATREPNRSAVRSARDCVYAAAVVITA